jgi:6-phosphogluconolactonase
MGTCKVVKNVFYTMLLCLIACLIVPFSHADLQVHRVYVGTYTGGESEGIYLLEFDGSTGALENKGLACKAENPSFLALHPTLPVVYAAGETAGESAVSAFRIEDKDGTLNLLNQVSSGGGG